MAHSSQILDGGDQSSAHDGLRIVVAMYFRERGDPARGYASPATAVVLVLLAAVVLLLGVLPSPVLSLMVQMASRGCPRRKRADVHADTLRRPHWSNEIVASPVRRTNSARNTPSLARRKRAACGLD